MSILTEKISEYYRISGEISTLEKGLYAKEQELERRYLSQYSNLKRELGGYISRIKPTVEILCNLYRATVSLSNNKLRLGTDIPTCSFTPINACDVAMKAGNESLNFLSAVIKKSNVSVNLREFVIRYNTVIEIFSSIDTLKKQAVSMEMANYEDRIRSLKSNLRRICHTKEEFDLLLAEMKRSSDSLCRRVFLGDEREMESELVTEISLPVGYESYAADGVFSGSGEDVMVSSLDWDLHKDGIFVIKAENDDIDDSSLSACSVNTAIQFLFAYPTFNKRIMLCDSRSSAKITSFAGILKSENNAMFFDSDNNSYVKNSDTDIREALSNLNRIINDRLMNNIGPSPYKDVLSFNRSNPDNPIPLIFVLLSGYPYRYEGAADDLIGIFKNGKKAGVYVMLVESVMDDEESRCFRSRLPKTDDITDNIADFKIKSDGAYLIKDNKKYHADIRGRGYNISRLMSAFSQAKGGNEKQLMYLESILPAEDFASSDRRVDYSRVLSIPVGKQGTKLVNVSLDASTTLAHLAVIGSSGSGKTAFLNTLVLSMCNLYSPDEVELHMILMAKDDFLIFKKQNLPHLKNIVTGDQVSRANDVLDYLNAEMERRRMLIGTDGNIYKYNLTAQRPLTRCVIIIDEFYELVKNDREAVDKLVEFAYLGRSFGISLVLSSIRFPIDVRSIIPQVGNRVEFASNENAGNLIELAEKRQSELGPGLCLLESNKNISLATIAFSDESEALEERIKRACNKYPDHRMQLQNVVSATRIFCEEDVPYTVRDESDAPNAQKIAIRNYTKDWSIRVRLGKRDLFNSPLEYTFNNNNNVLFLFGRYSDTKLMEASLIKDTLVLSRDIDAPTVYYVDCNDDVNYRDQSTVIKRVSGIWSPLRMVYDPNGNFDRMYDDISELIVKRITDRSTKLYPILVVISQAGVLFQDRDRRGERLIDLISRGKKALINFVIQLEKPIRPRGLDEYMTDAIIFPGDLQDEYSDPTAFLRSCLERMPAGSGPNGRKLLAKITKHGIDRRLHVLCNKNAVSLFLPYEYDEDYLKSIVDIGDLL